MKHSEVSQDDESELSQEGALAICHSMPGLGLRQWQGIHTLSGDSKAHILSLFWLSTGDLHTL